MPLAEWRVIVQTSRTKITDEWLIMAVSNLPSRSAASAAASLSAPDIVQHWIGGRLTKAQGRTLEVFNPATGQAARRVAMAGNDEVGAAVASAQAAFPAWADTPPVRRARVLVKFLNLLDEHRDELAAIITSEHGKVFTDAQGEVTGGVEIVEFDAARDFALRVREYLAVLTGDDCGEFIAVLIQQVEKLDQHARAADRRRVGPGRESRLRA